jgi:CheY-like chemotaxis protein
LSEEILKGSETVLFIDDEEIILEVGQDMLETMGYAVLLAKSGNEAIDIYKESKDQIDIVILDLIMPGMGGNETYDKLKQINPNIKALLSSGYSIDGLAKTILANGCDGFIQKPFGLSDLSQKIRKILDKK